MTDLTWTDEPPSEEGWYWARTDNFTTIRQVFAKASEPYFVANFGSRREYVSVHDERIDETEWAGPIPEPSERTEHQPDRHD